MRLKRPPIHDCAPARIFGVKLPCPVCFTGRIYRVNVGDPVGYEATPGRSALIPVFPWAAFAKETVALTDCDDRLRLYGYWRLAHFKTEQDPSTTAIKKKKPKRAPKKRARAKEA